MLSNGYNRLERSNPFATMGYTGGFHSINEYLYSVSIKWGNSFSMEEMSSQVSFIRISFSKYSLNDYL